jgi:hypothetical protein
MATPVIHGAITACTMGVFPSTLNVLPMNRTTIQGLPMANIADSLPIVNVAPFGLCNSLANPATALLTAAALGVLTPGPCVPQPVGPWSPGASKSTVAGLAALTNSCSCKCGYLGEITISAAGVINVTIT